MLVAVCYEWEIHSHFDWCKSLDGFSVPIQVTGCWLPPLGYTRKDFSIQVGHQYCWCKLLLCCNVHFGIVHQDHIWYLTDIFHWRRHFMLIDCQKGTNFHQCRILIHNPGWYLPHALCWCCVCCVKTFLRIHQLWVPSAKILVMRSSKTQFQEIGGHHIPHWGCPSWDCMMHPHHWPMFFVILLHQGGCYHIFLASFFWMLLHPIWIFFCVEYFLFPA